MQIKYNEIKQIKITMIIGIKVKKIKIKIEIKIIMKIKM